MGYMADDGIGARVIRSQYVGDWEKKKPRRTAGDSFRKKPWWLHITRSSACCSVS